jgi:signal transduction histidine kinase
MTTAIFILQVTSGLTFFGLGVLAFREWRRTHERGQLMIALAVGLLGVVSLLGRVGDIGGWEGRALSDLSLVGLLGSSLALMEFRHTVVPLRARTRRFLFAMATAILVPAMFMRWPRDPTAMLEPVQLTVALALIGLWIATMLEPAIRFARVARSRPPVERARLRLLSSAYFGMLAIVGVALANPQARDTTYALVVAMAGLAILPLLYGGLAPPAWLRRRWLNEEVKRERERMLLTLPAVVWTVDEQMRLTTAQGGALELLGGIKPEYYGRSLQQIHVDMAGADSEELRTMRAMHDRALAGETLTFDTEAVNDVTLHCRLDPIHGADGRIAGAMGFAIDISDRKRAEDLTRAAFEREHLAVERLRALDEMKNGFLSAVSHELRTPLAGVVGFASTLQHEDRLSPGDRRMMVERLIANANKLQRLLSDLLDVDRLSRGIIEPRRKMTDIVALALRVVDEWRIDAERTAHVSTGSLIAMVDGPKVERIIENLLANAAKYSPAGTPVWVDVAAVEGGVLITVEDAGPGIPLDVRTAMFEPFHRGAEHERGHTPGVGIGLSLVARFAELHGGTVTVGDREGGGASFKVFLASDTVERRGSDRPWVELTVTDTVDPPTAAPAEVH